MKWSILVLTMGLRRRLLDRLMTVLAPQICSEVELLVFEYSPELPVGENRERLRSASRGEYISFVDDDDLVPPDYVKTILPLLDGVDYVGFNVEQRINGSFCCIEQRSLRFSGVCRDGNNRYRDISHLNPIRRALALQVPMHGFPEEDTRWADGIRKLGIVKTEHYVNRTLYYYLFRTDKPEEQSHPAIPSMEVYPWLMKRTKVKMCCSIAGNAEPRYDQPEFGYAPGQVVEIHPDLAEAWIGSGLAERIEQDADVVESDGSVLDHATEEAAVEGEVVSPEPAVARGRARRK